MEQSLARSKVLHSCATTLRMENHHRPYGYQRPPYNSLDKVFEKFQIRDSSDSIFAAFRTIAVIAHNDSVRRSTNTGKWCQ